MAVTIRLTLGQLLEAIHHLPETDREILHRALESGTSRADIRREFEEALHEIWEANESFTEEEVAADVERAIREVR
jgi:hypothetical protein